MSNNNEKGNTFTCGLVVNNAWLPQLIFSVPEHEKEILLQQFKDKILTYQGEYQLTHIETCDTSLNWIFKQELEDVFRAEKKWLSWIKWRRGKGTDPLVEVNYISDRNGN